MRQADFYIFKIVAWFLCFYVAANALTGYEAVMNHTGALSYGQLIGAQVIATQANTTNLFNEGASGYALLALIGLSAAMFLREFLHLQKELRSLSLSESFGEVKT